VSPRPLTTVRDVDICLYAGGLDTSKTKGNVSYTPLTSTSPASGYWGVNQSVSYGGATLLPTTAGIVDTVRRRHSSLRAHLQRSGQGTTLLYLATDAYDAYVAATGATLDSQNTGLLMITPTQYAALQPLVFDLGAAGTYSLSPNAQIWPRALNAQIGGDPDTIYLVASDVSGSESEECQS
jgi:hypothetical protein